jgi:cell division protein FtsL
MKDIKPLLLMLLSGGLVATWVYHLYDKNLYSHRIVEKIPVRDSVAIADAVRDSLQMIYSASLAELDSTKTDVDSLNTQLDSQVNEITKLKKEVGDILKNRKATKADLGIARKKINQMKAILAGMKGRNLSLEQEKRQLNSTLNQLSEEMGSLKVNIEKLGKENKELAETVNAASTFIVSDLNFKIIDKRSRKEVETSDAGKADKIIFSFNVQNNIVRFPAAEVYVIITDPIGRVIQNPIWNSGNFITKTEGTKAFSIKDRFEYDKGDKKFIIYTIEPDKFIRGTYKLEAYHNGVVIGETAKRLG